MDRPTKRQQGFQLPEEVIAWLNGQEAATGATLSRIALAAFCAYVLRNDNRQREAMQFAMLVERGDISFLKLREAYLMWELNATRTTVEHLQKGRSPEEVKELKAALKRAEERLEAYRRGSYTEG